MQVNVTLEELLLDTNQVDDEAVEHIAKMLAVNKSLRVVNLGANRIGDSGAAALAEMLKSNTTLRELDLGSNEIGYDGAPPLRRSLVSPCMCAMHWDAQASWGSMAGVWPCPTASIHWSLATELCPARVLSAAKRQSGAHVQGPSLWRTR